MQDFRKNEGLQLIVSINQPAYLPWLGYFDRIFNSDIHVVLDHVQFEKNSMINRNKILSNQREQFLTIPVMTKGRFGELAIDQIKVSNNVDWRRKHYQSLQQAYSKARYKDFVLEKMEPLYEGEKENYLAPILRLNLEIFLKLLSINNTSILYSSEMNCRGSKSDLILDICRLLGATVYISGPFGKNYLNEDEFSDAGIKIIYQNYKHPIYRQKSNNFISHISTLDLIMNHGDYSLDIITHRKLNHYMI
jgi:hypothetical protein